MSIGKKDKDHLKVHGGVTLAEPFIAPKSEDPLQFWTGHRTENTLVDLHSFADGEFKNSLPLGQKSGLWGGNYTGRPLLIVELAPAIQARCSLLGRGTANDYVAVLRAWWRLFDAFEKSQLPDGRQVPRVQSVADLNELHAAFAQQRGLLSANFRTFLKIANDTRKMLKLLPLLWDAPKQGDPVRNLIPDDQARELKIVLKQDWERVRRTWARNDAIIKEAERRVAGMPPSVLDEEGKRLLKNWQHFQRIQVATESFLPSGKQLLDGRNASTQCVKGLERQLMRSILFPTVEEADIAYHMALMNSGWNPSTMVNVDASSPFLITPHPKNAGQLVLSVDADEEVTLQGNKPRARGKTQFCTGLAKHSSSSPVIVDSYLERVKPLREILRQEYAAAKEKLERMQMDKVDQHSLEKQYKKVQQLWQGCRIVWLYVDSRGNINWLDWRYWSRYLVPASGSKSQVSYLDLVLERLNVHRAEQGKPPIAKVTPSDFRDIYARWIYIQSGGNILAVMQALGHSSISSTVNYVENNIFSAENDEHARRFMTHLFEELRQGRVDLTILAQLVRHGPLTPEMEARLIEYRKLMRSRIGVGCSSPRHPPPAAAPNHIEGRLCATHRCLNGCPNAKFLPESLDGISMCVEELMAMSEHLPRETWLRGEHDMELESGEYLLEMLYPKDAVNAAREKWRERIASGEHPIPGLGRIAQLKEIA